MKKRTILSLFLVSMLMVSLVATPVLAEYLPKNNSKSNNSSNILLVYTGYYNPANYDGEKIGDYDKDKFLPYVGYLDKNGRAQDYFFDTFLMLATSSPYGGSLARYYDWVPNSKPGTLKDWQWAMDRMFIKNLQLDALDQAVKEVSSQLVDPDKKVNVYLTMPLPDPQSKDFGDFNGDGKVKNLEDLETRKELIKWYIDTMIERFNEQDYKYLNLSGFYWLQEDLDTAVPGEKESVQYTAEYLNSMGLRLGWIPWFGAGEKANGNRLGFDFSLIQPNHFFEVNTTFKRIEETADLAHANETGVEIEFDQRAVESPRYRQALYNYLIGGVKKGFMKDSILAYYQDVYAIYDLCHHESPFARQLYRDIYEFSKGIYEAPVGNFEGRVVDDEGNPIEGATLTYDSGQVISDSDGNFVIKGLFATQHELHIEKRGVASKSIKVDIPVDETLYQDIVLIKTGTGTVKEAYKIADFEDSSIQYGSNNSSYATCTLVSNSQYVYDGNQALKVEYKAYKDNWIRAYIDSDFFSEITGSDSAGTAYTLRDWSTYDSISMAVYNPTDREQVLRLEFMHGDYSWAENNLVVRDVTLEPQEWTIIEQPITDMEQRGANTKNMVRIALTRYNQSEDVTLYFDDFKLLKYADLIIAPDYVVTVPSNVPTMDVGESWKPVVINRAEKDAKGHPATVEAQLTSSNPKVIEILDDGTIHGVSTGIAVVRAHVENIEACSVVVEVSPWKLNELKGGKLPLSIGKTTRLRLISSFENGYVIPLQGVTYKWEIEGDSIEKVGESNNILTVKGVKKGKAKVKVSMTYNGKTETFERVVRVVDDQEIDLSDLEKVIEKAEKLANKADGKEIAEKEKLVLAIDEAKATLTAPALNEEKVQYAVYKLNNAMDDFKEATQNKNVKD